MIELSLTELALVVVGGVLAVGALGILLSGLADRRADRAALRTRVICRLCLAVFEDHGRDRQLKCPACGADTGRDGPQPLG